MDKLTPKLTDIQIRQNIDALKAAGKQTVEIQAYVDNYKRDPSGGFVLKNSPVEQKDEGFMAGIKSSFDRRVDAASEEQAKAIQGELSPVRATLRTIGQGAGFVGDVAGQTVMSVGKAVLPKSAEDKIASVASKVFSTKPVQEAVDLYTQFSQKYPEAAKDLEAALNIGSLIPIGIGAKTAVAEGSEAALKGVGEVVAMGGRATKGIGEVTYQSAITPTVKEAEKILTYRADTPFIKRVVSTVTGKDNRPLTRAQTAVEKGVKGTESQIGIQARRQNEALWKEIEPEVKNSSAIVTKDDLFAPIVKRINDTAEPGRKKALTEAFEAIQDDYKDINTLSLDEAQKIKRGLDEFTPEKVFRGKSVASEYQTLKADMANAIRQRTYDSLSDTNIKKKYLDWANLKELEKIGVKAISEGGRKGGFGGFWTSMWDTATIPIKTVGGSVLYRVGDFFEFIGEKGIKKFGEFLQKNGIEKSVN